MNPTGKKIEKTMEFEKQLEEKIKEIHCDSFRLQDDEWLEKYGDKAYWKVYLELISRAIEGERKRIEGIVEQIKERLLKVISFTDDGQLGDPNGAKCYQANKYARDIHDLLSEIKKGE